MNNMRTLKNNDNVIIPRGLNYILSGTFFSETKALHEDFLKMQVAVEGFMKYLPKEIVATFLNHSEAERLFRPFTQHKELCFVFTDIKNFTTITESLKPKQLIEMLMVYFDKMTEVVRRNKGTLDKYIGDALMCFWNAPLQQQEYIRNACMAALQMDQACKQLSKKFVRQGLPELVTRIGVHSGPCLVGNSGSTFRLAYTAIGEHVNLAADLEAMNKEYGTTIMCSDVVYMKVRSSFYFRLLDTIESKLYPNGIKIYEILEMNIGEKATAAAIRFSKAYTDLFLVREFEKALVVFEDHLQQYPGDLASKNLINLCNMYIKEPPKPDWTGVTEGVEHAH
ncbi:hypothetical protein AKO1_013242 [Acrasis kona]|uniref:Guanylate cyclase domain-containing protein n=1 Tax=Acrasis kona TaxID=1008807 RepID=A0AAW2YX70_9EUKA